MEIWTTAATWLLNQGWAGIVVLMLAAAVYDQRREIVSLRSRNATLQDQRVSDFQATTREVIEALGTTRAAVQSWTEVMRERKGQ